MTSLVLNGHTISVDGQPIKVPAGFSAQTFQDQINTAYSWSLLGSAGTNVFLAQNFIWGGQGDLQRPGGALTTANLTYTAIAAYLYGACAVVSGLTLDQALFAAGALNEFSTNTDRSGTYGLPQARVDQITQAFTDYGNGFFSVNSSTSLATMNQINLSDADNLPSVPVAFIKTEVLATVPALDTALKNAGQLLKGFETSALSSASTSVQTAATSVSAAVDKFMIDNGCYVPTLSDANGSSSAVNNIAASIVTAYGFSSGIDISTLQRINFAFSDASLSVGGLVHIPLGFSISVTQSDRQLSALLEDPKP